MKFIKKNNIHKGLAYLCVTYILILSFLAFQAYSRGESFNWLGYMLLFALCY